MRAKEKAKELIDYAVKLHGSEDAKDKCLITVDQIMLLAPFEDKEYWKQVKNYISYEN
jgi:hypothetical protein